MLTARLGIAPYTREHSLEATAALLGGASREWVRQIENKALGALRQRFGGEARMARGSLSYWLGRFVNRAPAPDGDLEAGEADGSAALVDSVGLDRAF